MSTLQMMISKWKAKSFANHWNTVDLARQTKNFIMMNKSISAYIISLSRRNIKRMTEVLTGHCKLNKHLHTIGLSDGPLCHTCDGIETAEHFLFQCPSYMKSRDKHLGSYTLSYGSISHIPPKYILEFNPLWAAQQAHLRPRCRVQ